MKVRRTKPLMRSSIVFHSDTFITEHQAFWRAKTALCLYTLPELYVTVFELFYITNPTRF